MTSPTTKSTLKYLPGRNTSVARVVPAVVVGRKTVTLHHSKTSLMATTKKSTRKTTLLALPLLPRNVKFPKLLVVVVAGVPARAVAANTTPRTAPTISPAPSSKKPSSLTIPASQLEEL
jgi:hypothetical protein